MRLAFQRPLWLEFTAFASVMMGFIGHLLGLWRFSLGIGLVLKVELMIAVIKGLQVIGEGSSWLVANLKEATHIFETFMSLPSWFQHWYFWSGFIELIVSTALFFVGIFFWYKKVYAVKFFYYVIGASIAVHVVNIISSMLISESLGMMKTVMDVPFLLLKIMLVPIVYFADKSVLGTHTRHKVNFEEMVV